MIPPSRLTESHRSVQAQTAPASPDAGGHIGQEANQSIARLPRNRITCLQQQAVESWKPLEGLLTKENTNQRPSINENVRVTDITRTYYRNPRNVAVLKLNAA